MISFDSGWLGWPALRTDGHLARNSKRHSETRASFGPSSLSLPYPFSSSPPRVTLLASLPFPASGRSSSSSSTSRGLSFVFFFFYFVFVFFFPLFVFASRHLLPSPPPSSRLPPRLPLRRRAHVLRIRDLTIHFVRGEKWKLETLISNFENIRRSRRCVSVSNEN